MFTTIQIIYMFASLGVIIFFGYFAMNSRSLLKKASKTQLLVGKVYYKLFGNFSERINVRLERAAKLNKKGDLYKIYNYFDKIIVNLELKKDDVTVSGLLIFMISISVVLGLLLGVLINSLILIIPLCIAIFYLTVVVFRLSAVVRYEKREAQIMDAIDLMVSDISSGVYNAIVKYNDSFHPNIKKHFDIFIDDKKNKGYSFKDAMLNLEQRLGRNFTSFAQKAILFETQGDDEMVDIFSPIIEKNSLIREIRYDNNIVFNNARMQFVVSLAIVIGYVFFSLIFDNFIYFFTFKTNVGKAMVLFDIVLISWVLSYLTSLKTKNL